MKKYQINYNNGNKPLIVEAYWIDWDPVQKCWIMCSKPGCGIAELNVLSSQYIQSIEEVQK